MVFTHDWPFPDLSCDEERYNKHLETIAGKYPRRIERFRELRNYSGKVFFIRTFSTFQDIIGVYGWNAEKAKNLKKCLDQYFPNLDFTLVILSCSDPKISEIGEIEGTLEFKIKNLYIQSDYFPMFDILQQKGLQ